MAPVITYKDLDRQDITLLTQVLSQASHGQNASSTSHAHVASLIANLPSHLKSRLPCLAPGCPIHKRLNMAPLDELAGEFRFEISDFVPMIWEPLSKSAQFDYDQMSMLGALGAVSGLRTDGCSACWLEFVGSHIDGSVALGAFIIGRVNPSIYQKSKRLVWIEESLRQRLPGPAAEVAIKGMWEAGIGFRRVRKVALVDIGEGRQYVAEYVRRARDMDAPSSMMSAPASTSRSGASTIDMNVWLDDLPGNDHAEAVANPPTHLIRRVPVPETMKPPPRAAQAPQLQTKHQQQHHAGGPLSNHSRTASTTSQQQQQARIASSVYSRPESTASQQQPGSSNLSSWWNHSRPNSTTSSTDTQIIDLYRHSVFPHNTSFDDRSSTDSRKRSPINLFGRESPVSLLGTPQRHDSPQQESTAVATSTKRDTILQRRADSKHVSVLPFGGNPHVNTKGGIRAPGGWRVSGAPDGYLCVRIDGR